MPPRNLSVYRLAIGLPLHRKPSVMVWKLLIGFIFYQLVFGSKNTRWNWVSHPLLAFSSECLLEPSPPLLTLLKELQNTVILNTCYLFEKSIKKRRGSTVRQGRPFNSGHTRKEIRLQGSPCLRCEDPESPSPDPKVLSKDAWRKSLNFKLQLIPSTDLLALPCCIKYSLSSFEEDWRRNSKTERIERKELCLMTHSSLHPTVSLSSPALSNTNKQTQPHRFNSSKAHWQSIAF